jgi:hypothetical protein
MALGFVTDLGSHDRLFKEKAIYVGVVGKRPQELLLRNPSAVRNSAL